jgi:hypothetical protein
MSPPFRTVLHGTCLLDGRHPAGSKLARECPVLRRARRQRHDPGRAADPGASVPPGDTQLALPVRTPAERRRQSRARQIEAAGGLEAYRQQERERVRTARRRPPPATG